MSGFDNDGIKVLGVIPARWGSSRFPGKPLHSIAGKALVLRVWDQCQKCERLDDVVIATDDNRIYEAAVSYGANVVMTSEAHLTGTDRIAEVLEKQSGFSHVINIQGDEPLISPSLIDELAVEMIDDAALEMVSAATPLDSQALINDSNVVKVVVNQKRNALYFSRSAIPFVRDEYAKGLFFRHIGIYGYRADFLKSFIQFPASMLEEAESLEQLRALDQGATIRIVKTKEPAMGVDTLEQAQEIEQLILNGNHQ